MNTSKRTNIGKLVIASVVMLLFSSDRNLLITHYVLGGPKNSGQMTILFILIVLCFLLYLTVSKGSLSIRYSQRALLTAAGLLALYFSAHELIFGDGLTSAKYAVFLLILSFSLMIRYDGYFIFKILGYLGGLVSLSIIIQQLLLLTLNGGDVSQFEVAIRGDDWGRFDSCDFVKPYGLGLIERCFSGLDVSVAGLKMNRSIFFSTEPKYLSSVLLVTFSSLIISNTDSSIKSWMLALHILALSFAFSASAILILFFSGLLILVRFMGPVLFTSMVFLFPIFVFPLFFYLLTLITGIDGFLLNRLMSGSASVGAGGLLDFSIFGQAFGSCDEICKESKGLLSNVTDTYGLIGLSIFWVFLYFAITPMFKIIKNRKIKVSKRFGLMILLNTYVVFNIYFFGDIFNMFGLLILLTIILLPEYISDRTLVGSSIEARHLKHVAI